MKETHEMVKIKNGRGKERIREDQLEENLIDLATVFRQWYKLRRTKK